MNTKASDIEIYLANTAVDQCTEWLKTKFDSLEKRAKVKGMPKKAQPFTATWQESTFLVVIIEQVTPGFTSVWLNCMELPWEDDKQCALDAAIDLKTAVRITAGGWQQQDDPDSWLEISETGDVQTIQWQT